MSRADPTPIPARDLRAAAASLAADLDLHRDLRPGDRVLVRCPDPADQLIGALAVLHADAPADVAVLDPAWPGPVGRGAMRACAASVVLDPAPGGGGTATRVADPGPVREPGWIAFTSGSTGAPRAVRRTIASWTASHPAFDALTGIGPADRVLVPGSLAVSLCAFAALHAVAADARLVLLPRWDPAVVGEVDVLHVVPTMLADLLGAPPPGLAPRLVICAGATLGPAAAAAVVRTWPRTRLLEYYGSTEQSFVSVRADGPADTVGAAFPGVEVRIGGPRAGPAPAGTVGEIWVRSPYTAEAVLDAGRPVRLGVDGWVGVGDLGRVDRAGRLTLSGRRRILCGGVVVEPGAVESALRAAGAVDAVVLGLPHPRLGEVVCAVVDGGPGLRVLRTHVRTGLRAAERPRVWLTVSPLPRNAAGKVDRVALSAAASAGRLAALR